ncbi:penicillin acylase family protein [Sphingomonas flavalba]|uniref:penicillin acylase family protein n=1 Tax=Sphingomonas flavalba TaxID=2559804 RepID=UPI0039E12611
MLLPVPTPAAAWVQPDAGAPAMETVTIRRDPWGTPHVYGDTSYGLFYGFGYAMAEDRLYQLEMARRSGNGTVAEVLGADFVATDVATRTGTDIASIRRQMAALSAEDRAMFDGYAAGINARIAEVLAARDRLLPREFVDAGFDPQRWTAEDTALVWIGLILQRFFGGTMEVANLALLNDLVAARGERIGRQIYDQMRWRDDPRAPTIIRQPAGADEASSVPVAPKPATRATAPLRPLSSSGAVAFRAAQVALSGLAATEGMPTASNAWVLGPERTADGVAILHNGPQQGFTNPAFVAAIGLHGAGYDLTGMTPVGLLPVLFGTNGTIAWGSTVGSLDTNDSYQEQLNPADRYQYRFNGRFVAMDRRTETIRVKGEADRAVVLYATVHGPVQSWDLPNNTAYTIRRSWHGAEVETMLGWAKAAQASDWTAFMTQAARVSASITWFYADVHGNIGAAGLGALPRRPAKQDVRFPARGDGSMEWQGLLPFSANPKAYNPGAGYFASWNNKIAPGLRADGAVFGLVDRVNEITARLDGNARLTREAIWDVGNAAAHADLNIRYFRDGIGRAAAALAPDNPARQAADAVLAWDMQLTDADRDGHYDGPGVTILQAWLSAMAEAVFADDLPPAILDTLRDLGYPAPGGRTPGSVRPAPVASLLFNALRGGAAGVPQHYDFLNGASADAVVRAALEQAVGQLRHRFGADMARWLTPAAAHRFSKVNAIGVPWAAADRTAALYQNRGTADVQYVLRPGGMEMCSLMAPGQSGFVGADGRSGAHGDDQITLFERGACKPQAVGAAQLATGSATEKTLAVPRDR